MKAKAFLFVILFLFPSVSFSYTAQYTYPYGVYNSMALDVENLTYEFDNDDLNKLTYSTPTITDPETEFGIVVTSD